MKKVSFHWAFQITRMIVFEVSYYHCGSNKEPYFTTSAAQFNQPKTDFNHCGQAQNELLKGHVIAMQFFEKWDKFHLKKLTRAQFNEMVNDLNSLCAKYKWIKSNSEISFYDLKTLSKLK